MAARNGFRWQTKPPIGTAIDRARVPAFGLMGGWRYDDAALYNGGAVPDYSGRGRTGSLVANPSFVTPRIKPGPGPSAGMGLDLDSSNQFVSQGVTLPPGSLPGMGTTSAPDFTVFASILLRSYTAGATLFIHHSGSFGNQLSLTLDSSGVARFIFDSAGLVANTAVPLNKVVRLAFVKSGTSQRYYIDGLLDATYTGGASVTGDDTQTILLPSVGLSGQMFDARIYGRARTDAEVKADAAAPWAEFTAPAARRFFSPPAYGPRYDGTFPGTTAGVVTDTAAVGTAGAWRDLAGGAWSNNGGYLYASGADNNSSYLARPVEESANAQRITLTLPALADFSEGNTLRWVAAVRLAPGSPLSQSTGYRATLGPGSGGLERLDSGGAVFSGSWSYSLVAGRGYDFSLDATGPTITMRLVDLTGTDADQVATFTDATYTAGVPAVGSSLTSKIERVRTSADSAVVSGGPLAAAAAAASVSTLAGSATLALKGAASAASVSTLTAGASLSLRAAASPAAVSTLAGAASLSLAGSAPLASVSTLTASASSPLAGSAPLASVSTLTAAASLAQRASASASAVSTLTAGASLPLSASASATPVATLTADATAGVPPAAAVAACVSALAASATLALRASAAASSVSTLTASASVTGQESEPPTMPLCTPLDKDAASTLGATYTSGSTSLTVAPGTGSRFGSPSPSAPVRVTVIAASALDSAGRLTPPTTAYCTFRCTARSGDVLSGLTLERGSAQGFAVGDPVGALVTEDTVGDIHAALALLAPLASPPLTGTPTAPTATAGTNTTQLATTAFVLANAGAGGGAVSSVAGRTGAVVLAQSDVTGLAAALAAKGVALTDVGVKTSAYSAGANEQVRTDTTSAGVTVTLPTAPADKSRVLVKMTVQGGTSATAVVCGGADTLNRPGGGTSFTLSMLNQAVAMQYVAATSVWVVQDDDMPLSGLDARYLSPTGSGAGLTGIAESQVTGLVVDLAARLAAASNLSDLASASTARTNLGLGTAATTATSAYATAAQGTKADSAVQSVSLATPGILYTNPVTFSVTSGAASGTLALATQAANTVLAGPATGADATPTMRALAAADLPAHSAALLTSGTVGTARLGTGTASGTTYLRGDGTWSTPASGGTIASTALVLKGDGSGNAVAATAGTDYLKASGVSGGQTAYGGTATADKLNLYANSANVGAGLTISPSSLSGQVILDTTAGGGFMRLATGVTFMPNTDTGSSLGSTSAYFSNTYLSWVRCKNSLLVGVDYQSATLPTNGAVIEGPSAVGSPSVTAGMFTVCGQASQSTPLVPLQQLSSTSTARSAGYLDATLATATDASWKGRATLYAGDFTSTNLGKREGVRVESDGTQPLLGFYGHAAVARAATPTTLADVISLLQSLGLCS